MFVLVGDRKGLRSIAMKFLTGFSVFAIGAIGSYLFFAPTFGLLNTQQFDKVVIKVKGNPKELKVTSKASSKCKARPNRPGCIEVEQDDFATVPVRMGWVSGWNWHIETFEICEYDTNTPTGKRNLQTTPDCEALSEEQAKDFVIAPLNGSNPKSPTYPEGIVDLTQFAPSNISGIHGFDIRNFNVLPGEYFYRIKACRDDDRSVCLWLDR